MGILTPVRLTMASAGHQVPGDVQVKMHSDRYADLSTVALNDIPVRGLGSFVVATPPTPRQKKVLKLLGVDPVKIFPAAGR